MKTGILYSHTKIVMMYVHSKQSAPYTILKMHHTCTIHALYKVLSNKIQSNTLEGHRGKKSMYTYSCTVHVWCMYGACVVLCMVHVWCIKNKIQALGTISQQYTVHVWCMYGAFMTKIILKKNNKPIHLAKLKDCGLVQ